MNINLLIKSICNKKWPYVLCVCFELEATLVTVFLKRVGLIDQNFLRVATWQDKKDKEPLL